jgi:hypothetical protein
VASALSLETPSVRPESTRPRRVSLGEDLLVAWAVGIGPLLGLGIGLEPSRDDLAACPLSGYAYASYTKAVNVNNG